MYRPSDVRRVQAVLDATLDAPYEAEVQLENMRKTMRVSIMDPDDAELPVAQAVWWFDENLPKSVAQPSNSEVTAIADSLKQACTDYPTRKAAEAVEQAERASQQAKIALAKAADQQAQLVQAEEIADLRASIVEAEALAPPAEA